MTTDNREIGMGGKGSGDGLVPPSQASLEAPSFLFSFPFPGNDTRILPLTHGKCAISRYRQLRLQVGMLMHTSGTLH